MLPGVSATVARTTAMWMLPSVSMAMDGATQAQACGSAGPARTRVVTHEPVRSVAYSRAPSRAEAAMWRCPASSSAREMP